MAKTIRRKNLKSRTHVVIAGNLALSGFARVGGHLTIEGDLRVDGTLACLGHLTVKGSLQAGQVLVGLGMDVAGDLRASSIWAYGGWGREADLQSIAESIITWPTYLSPSDDVLARAVEMIVDESTLDELSVWFPWQLPVIKVDGDCSVAGLVRAFGCIEVGEHFNPDNCTVTGGIISAKTVGIDGDLDCGSLYSQQWIFVEGDLNCSMVECSQLTTWGTANVYETIVATGGDTYCDGASPEVTYRSTEVDYNDKQTGDIDPSIQCGGQLVATAVTSGGSILVDDLIACKGYLKANRTITCGGTITTGKQFGILAGLDVSRDKWLTDGYVCAAQKPLRILTGNYRPLGRRRRGSDPKPARLK
jgi:hypothetical protein